MFIEHDGKFEIIAKYKTNNKEYDLDAVISGNKYDLLARQEDIEELVDTEGEVSVKVIDNRPKNLKLDFVNHKHYLNDEEVDFYDVADFKRASKAWDFTDSGLKEFSIDEPRYRNGLLIEPESTNYLLDNMNPSTSNWSRTQGLKAEKNTTLSGYDLIETTDSNIDAVYQTNTYSENLEVSSVFRSLYYIENKEVRESSLVSFRNRLDGAVNGSGILLRLSTNVVSDPDDILDHDLELNYAKGLNKLWIESDYEGKARGYYLRGINRDLGLMLTYFAGQVEFDVNTSLIVTEEAPTTRAKDFLVLNIPKGYTIQGDWDDTLELYEEKGRLQYTGYGCIRTLEVVPMVKTYKMDFTQNSIISHTGFKHKGIFDRGIVDFERLSKAWDFTESGLKEYGIDEPRISGKGLLIEPESTNYLLYNNELDNDYWKGSGSIIVTADKDKVSEFQWMVSKEGNLVRYAVVPQIDGKVATFSCAFPKPVSLTMATRRAGGTNSVDLYIDKESVTSNGSVILDKVHQNQYEVGATRKGEPYSGPSVSAFRIFDYQEEDYYLVCAPQWELGELMTSRIITSDTPTTRLPDTLIVPIKNITIDADEGITQTGNELTGFGYIRSIEVKQ